MISVFVVEDEEAILTGTLEMLKVLSYKVVGYADNIDKAFEGIKQTQPDVVLLDVEIGDLNAFDLLERFNEINFKIVFATAHQKYALNAFKFSAVDFLLKPLNLTSVSEALQKATSQVLNDQKLAMKALQHNLLQGKEERKLILKTQEKIHLLETGNIIRCESDQSYTIFITSKDKIIVSKTLAYYDELLTDHGFYRIHKSHLVNLKHINRIHKADGGEVEMSDGSLIGISQRKKEDFLKQIDQLGLS